MFNRRRLIVLGIVVVVITALGLVWRAWRGNRATPAGESATSTTSLFPSGGVRPGITPTAPATTTPTQSEEGDIDRSGRWYRVAARPVGGAIMVGQASSSALVYVERATGHLYRFSSAAAGAERVSNTTIPQIYRLLGGQRATSTQIIFQYLKEGQVQTFSGELDLGPASAGEDFLTPVGELTPLAGNFLAPNIASFTVSPSQNQAFWLEPSGGEMLGYLSPLATSSKALIWRSSHPEWRARWVATSTIALQTSASSQAAGSLYYLNPATKALQPMITGVTGLTALPSPSLKQIFYSGQTDRGLVSGFYDPSKRFFGRLNFQTWAEKCAWNRAGTTLYCAVPSALPGGYRYPDDWYRGEARLSDNIWQIDAASSRAEIIFNPSQNNANFTLDAENLLLDGEEKALYLTNRADQQLWALNLQVEF